jgi:hypothetical protein
MKLNRNSEVAYCCYEVVYHNSEVSYHSSESRDIEIIEHLSKLPEGLLNLW